MWVRRHVRQITGGLSAARIAHPVLTEIVASNHIKSAQLISRGSFMRRSEPSHPALVTLSPLFIASAPQYDIVFAQRF